MKALVLFLTVAVLCTVAVDIQPYDYHFARHEYEEPDPATGPWCWVYKGNVLEEAPTRNPASAVHYDYLVLVTGEVWPEDLFLVVVTPDNLRDWLSHIVPRTLSYQSLEYLPASAHLDKQFVVRNSEPVCVGIYNPNNVTVKFDLGVDFELANSPYITASVTLGVLLAFVTFCLLPISVAVGIGWSREKYQIIRGDQ